MGHRGSVATREWDADADVARVQALTPAALLSVAQRYLDASRAQIVTTGDTSKIESQLRPLHLRAALRLRPYPSARDVTRLNRRW